MSGYFIAFLAATFLPVLVGWKHFGWRGLVFPVLILFFAYEAGAK